MASQQYSLLVVDDNEMNRDLLSRRLERQWLPGDRGRGWPASIGAFGP